MLLKTLEENFAETGDRDVTSDTAVSLEDVEVDGGEEGVANAEQESGGDIRVQMKIQEAVCLLYTDECELVRLLETSKYVCL